MTKDISNLFDEKRSENSRLVPPDSLEGNIFQRHMERITKALLPEYPLDSHPIIFLLSDDKSPNAGIFASHQPVIAVFSLSLLKRMRNEDEVAYVLGHELGHLALVRELGEGANSKGEEFIADIRQLGWMHAAGYDSRVGLEFLQRERSIFSYRKPAWFDYADVHGLGHNREDAVRDALAGLDRYVGGLHNKKREIAPELAHVISAARHISFIERVRFESKFDRLPLLEQLEIAKALIAQIPTGYAARMVDMRNLLGNLNPNLSHAEHVAAVNELIGTTLEQPHLSSFYGPLTEKLYPGQHPIKTGWLFPAGWLQTASIATQELIDAHELPKAEDAAARLVKEITSERFQSLGPWIAQKIQWPTFRLPSEEKLRKTLQAEGEVIPPWSRQAAMADKRPASQLAQALILMGIPDIGLLELCPDEFLQKMANGEIRPFTFPFDNEQEPVKVEIDTQTGVIVNVASKNIDYSLLAKTTLALRHKTPGFAANELTFCQTKPVEFAAQYDSYFDQNIETLITAESYIENSLTIISKLEGLLVTNQVEYVNFVRAYFLGRDDKRDLPSLLDRQVQRKADLSKYKDDDDENAGQISQSAYGKPYGRFIARDKFDLFSNEERGAIFYDLSLNPLVGENISSRPIDWWRKTLRYNEPTNLIEFRSVLKLYNNFAKGFGNVPPACDIEIQNFLKNQTPGQIPFASLLLNYTWLLASAAGRDSDEEYRSSEFSLAPFIEAEQNWPQSTKEQIRLYKALDQYRLFPSEVWRANFVKTYITSMNKGLAPAEKIKLTEALLLGHPLRDVDLREWAIEQWIGANHAAFGIDTGKASYHQQHDKDFTETVARVQSNAHAPLRYEMFSRLADALETQQAWSFELRNHVADVSRETLADSHVKGVFTEYTLDMLSETKKTRTATLAFLLAPLTNRSIITLNEMLDQVATDLSWQEMQASFSDRAIASKRLYDNFWSMPVPARIAFVDKLLLPSKDRMQDSTEGSESNYQDAFNYIADQVFPKNLPYSAEGRVFLECYSNVVPDYQRSLLLASMIAAGEKASGRGKNFGVGKRLAIMLELMGPAERKLGQQVHSHPQTPDDIRTDMGRMKSMAAPPTRWDLFDRLETIVPAEYRETFTRVGKLKGSASYFVTVALEKIDGTNSVIALQRANALAQAQEGFRLLDGLIGELQKKNATLANIADTLLEMVQQARRVSFIETDSEIGVQQMAIAQTMYNGTKITTGGRSFHITTAPWLAYGAEFREQREMPGVHFNDLPERTDKQKQYKRAVAKAYISQEVLNILAGGAFDHDRHGAQCRIDTKIDSINLFDHGALELEPPTTEEKRQLARALMHGFQAYQKGESISNVLFEEIHKLRSETGQTPDYLVRVERAMLAMTDFFRHITPADMPDILVGVYNTGRVDPTIQASIFEMAMSGQIDAATLMGSMSGADPIQITHTFVHAPPSPRRFNTTVINSVPGAYRMNNDYKEPEKAVSSPPDRDEKSSGNTLKRHANGAILVP